MLCFLGGFFAEGGFSAKFFPVAVFSMLPHQHCYGAMIIRALKECETTLVAKVSSCFST